MSILLKTLYIAVPSVHLFIIAISFITYPSSKKAPSKPLAIHTWTAPSKDHVKVASTPPSPLKKTVQNSNAIAKKTNKTPLNTPQKPASKKKETPKPIEKQVSKPSLVAQKHLQEIEERIAKIQAKNDRMPVTSELAVPGVITLSSQGPLEPVQTSHPEDAVGSITGYLQRYLQLPDIGEVQIQLTLRKDGKIESMKVIKAESEENRKYLEKHLPEISFPLSIIKGLSSRTFLLAFCNK
jgi:hypothetical protein